MLNKTKDIETITPDKETLMDNIIPKGDYQEVF